MKITGKFKGASRSLDDDLIVSFEIDADSDILKKLEDLGEIDLEIEKHRNKRSLSANAYLWKLCDLMAKKLGSDKETIYKLELFKYGTFVDVQIWTEAVEEFKREFKYIQELDDGYGETQILRCFFGSSKYNTKEMSDLLNGTRQDAIEIGCDVWDQDEIDALIREWKGEK